MSKALALVLFSTFAQASTISALSLNLACGAGDAWNTSRVRKVQRQFIANVGADFVGMQEVDVGVPRSGMLDVAAVVAPRNGTLVRGVAQPLEGGTYGNALWVSPRHTVLSSQTIVMDDHDREEPRSLLLAEVRLDSGRVIVVGVTHLSTYGRGPVALRREQLAVIAGYDIDILMGDFNAYDAEVSSQIPQSLVTPDAIDQVRAMMPGTGSLIPTNGASDHEFAAFAIFRGVL